MGGEWVLEVERKAVFSSGYRRIHASPLPWLLGTSEIAISFRHLESCDGGDLHTLSIASV